MGRRGGTRVAIFREKKIPRNLEQVGTDGSSVGIPPVSRKRKNSEFHSEPFLGREKPSEFHSEPFLGRGTPSEFRSEPFIGREKHRISDLNHFSEEKTPRNSVLNHLWMLKILEIRSESFSEQKNFGIPFRIIFGREKLGKKTTFVSCFVKLQYFAEFRSVPSYGMDSSEILGITRNEHFIPRNNEHRSESIPRNFFGTKFRWQP